MSPRVDRRTGRETACRSEVIRSIHGYAMDLLDLPATPSRMRVAAEAAGAPPSAVRQALTLAAASPSSRDWVQFLTGALLLLGAGLLLSGIVCFFAFNWADLGRFAKFGVLEAAVATCAGLGWWKLREPVGPRGAVRRRGAGGAAAGRLRPDLSDGRGPLGPVRVLGAPHPALGRRRPLHRALDPDHRARSTPRWCSIGSRWSIRPRRAGSCCSSGSRPSTWRP